MTIAMNIIPKPKEIITSSGFFYFNNKTVIEIDNKCSSGINGYALDFKKDIFEKRYIDLTVTRVFSTGSGENKISFIFKPDCKEEEYYIHADKKSVCVKASSNAGFMYALETLKQIIYQNDAAVPCLELHDFPDYKIRGYYYDVTRGRIPTKETFKEIIDTAAKYKLNQLQLYVEHTFAYRNMSEVWRGSDCLTSEDILELDAYCQSKNIELVPSFATFGHMYHVLKSKSFHDLNELEIDTGKRYSWIDRMIHYTLNPENPQSVELVKRIIDETAPLFSSDKYNICCDETFDLGTGKSKSKAEEIGKGELYLKFFEKICSYVKSKGKTPMCWCDVILNHRELIEKLPQGVIYMDWYYNGEAKEENTKAISETKNSFYVCSGINGWNRLIPDIELSFVNIRSMIKCGYKYGAEGYLNTDWGDYGHINSVYASMPAMVLGAGGAWNVCDMPSKEEISENLYGSEDIIEKLEDLYKNDLFKWGLVVSFIERKKGYDDPAYRTAFSCEYTDKYSYEDICRAYDNALKYAGEFLHLKNISFSYRVFSNHAEGIALFDALLAIIKMSEFKQECKYILSPYDLAQSFEKWFYDYEKLWRMKFRESELYRIKESIYFICDYLRDLKETV